MWGTGIRMRARDKHLSIITGVRLFIHFFIALPGPAVNLRWCKRDFQLMALTRRYEENLLVDILSFAHSTEGVGLMHR